MSNQGIEGELQAVDVDVEWVYLLMSAKKAGIKAEDVRQFLNHREKASSLQVM